jgi:hypothetical protein
MTGTLEIVDDAITGPQAVALSYTNSGAYTVQELAFNGWSIGATGALELFVNLPQRGDSAELTISGPNASDFEVLGNATPLPKGENSMCSWYSGNTGCTPAIYFSPSALGTRTAILSVVLDGVGPMESVILTGTGQPAGINFQVYSIFGLTSYALQDYVNTSQSYPVFTITNSGTVPVTLNAPLVTGAQRVAILGVGAVRHACVGGGLHADGDQHANSIGSDFGDDYVDRYNGRGPENGDSHGYWSPQSSHDHS